MDEIYSLIAYQINDLDGRLQEYLEEKSELERKIEDYQKQIVEYDVQDVNKIVGFLQLYADYGKCVRRYEDLPELIKEVEDEIDDLCDINIKIYNLLQSKDSREKSR